MNIKRLRILESNDINTAVYFRATDVLNIYFFLFPCNRVKIFYHSIKTLVKDRAKKQ